MRRILFTIVWWWFHYQPIMSQNSVNPFMMTGIGLKYPFPYAIIKPVDPATMASTFRYLRLREKLERRIKRLKRICKVIILPTFFILSAILLYLIAPFIGRFFPGFQTVFGIGYGILTYINMVAIIDIIDGSRVFHLHYYKHRKFQKPWPGLV